MQALTVWLRRLRVMTSKELLQFSRDFVLVLFTVYAFTMDVYLAGSGVSLSLNNAATVVYDGDRSQASRELVSRFREPYFKEVGQLSTPEASTSLLDSGAAMVALDIPEHFEKDLLRGEQTSVQMQIDTTNTVLGLLASSYGAQIVGQYGLDVALQRLSVAGGSLSSAPSIVDDHRVWFNPNSSDAWFMSISEMLTVITLFSLMLPAAAMVREKERGTIEQLLVSPLSPLQVMLPKIMSMTLVIVALTALCLLLVVRGIFAVPFEGSLLLFFAITTLYVFTTAGLGLAIATFARNMAQAGMLIILFIAPMIFLSGAFTPPEAMPPFIRQLMLLSPLHYFIDATYGIMLKGAGVNMLAPQLLGMSVLGALNFGLGLWRFRRQFE